MDLTHDDLDGLGERLIFCIIENDLLYETKEGAIFAKDAAPEYLEAEVGRWFKERNGGQSDSHGGPAGSAENSGG